MRRLVVHEPARTVAAAGRVRIGAGHGRDRGAVAAEAAGGPARRRGSGRLAMPAWRRPAWRRPAWRRRGSASAGSASAAASCAGLRRAVGADPCSRGDGASADGSARPAYVSTLPRRAIHRPGFGRNRQLEDEAAADAAGPRLVPEMAAVGGDDAERDRQTQAGSLARLLGGEERVEEAGPGGLRARPGRRRGP